MLQTCLCSPSTGRQQVQCQKPGLPFQFSSVHSLGRVWLFVTTWTAGRQASLSITNSWSLLKLMSIESVTPSNYLILCRPLCLQSFPASGSFPMSQFFPSGGQSIGVSASASVLPMNIQDWFPLGRTFSFCILGRSRGRVPGRSLGYPNIICPSQDP